MDRSWAWVRAAWPYATVLLVAVGARTERSPFVAGAALANALLVFVAFFVATALHELGHAVVARRVGARAHNAAWLAIAEARRGRSDHTAHWRAEAERDDPGCASLELLDREPPR